MRGPVCFSRIRSTSAARRSSIVKKVVIARGFSAGAEVLVVAQPTRGVDIGAAENIHEQLLDQRRNGAAILLISEDLDEVLAMSGRVVVLLEGEVMGEVPAPKQTLRTSGYS